MFRRPGVVQVLVVLMSGWYRLARAGAVTADGAAASAQPMKAVRMRPPVRRPATREAVFAAEESMVLVGRSKMPYLLRQSLE